MLFASVGLSAVNVQELGLVGDGKTDNTVALQKALSAGKTELCFPAGSYVLGTVELPAQTVLSFSPKAKIKINPQAIRSVTSPLFKDRDSRKESSKVLFILKGDRITLDGLDVELTAKDAGVVDILAYGEKGLGNHGPAVPHHAAPMSSPVE